MNNITNIEKEINDLESCNWNTKINNIKKIKLDIKNEEENINKLLNELENDLTNKKIKKNTIIDIDEIINDFNNTNDINKKIIYYHSLNNYVKQINNELFD